MTSSGWRIISACGQPLLVIVSSSFGAAAGGHAAYTAHSSQVSAHNSQGSAHSSQVSAHKFQLTAHSLPMTTYSFCSLQLTVNKSQLTTCSLLMTTFSSQLITHRQNLSAHNSQLSNDNSQLVATAQGQKSQPCSFAQAEHQITMHHHHASPCCAGNTAQEHVLCMINSPTCSGYASTALQLIQCTFRQWQDAATSSRTVSICTANTCETFAAMQLVLSQHWLPNTIQHDDQIYRFGSCSQVTLGQST